MSKAMSRHELREQVFLLLFRADFYDEDGREEQEGIFLEALAEKKEKDREAIRKKYEEIVKRLPELDEALNEKADGWKTSRMGKAELTILRLAVYELLFDEDIPTGVAINEAVELAKEYGSDDAGAFVNGILSKFA